MGTDSHSARDSVPGVGMEEHSNGVDKFAIAFVVVVAIVATIVAMAVASYAQMLEYENETLALYVESYETVNNAR